jgi:phosphoribosyl-dephospho-CoA transferase
VHPAAWAKLLRARSDLSGEPLLHDWAARGWPLIARRRGPLDGAGVLLGLPLPPSSGKRRIVVEMQVGDVASTSPLPSVSEVLGAAPVAWQPCLRELTDLSREYGVHGGVFGSLGWQWLTGLTYLGPGSDIDIAWTLPRPERLERFLADLADIDTRATMRLDGELVHAEGAAANWRELHAGGPDLVVKTADQVLLCARADFVGAAP